MDIFFCVLSWTLTGLFLLFFFILAYRSNMLRDEIDNPAAFVTHAVILNSAKYKGMAYDDIPRPFSLARTQFALWTVVIASVYLYHLLCMKNCPPLTMANSTTTLALLGISAGTTGMANIIDKSKVSTGSILPRHQNEPSQGFFYDILSDESGISIHRFQNVVWTVAAIVIYLAKASSGGCALPELDGTLLTLSGISSAAYLGLKVNENK